MFAADALRVSEATLGVNGIQVDAVQIDRPRGRAAREADGSLVAGGVRLIKPAPATQPAPGVGTVAAPTTGASAPIPEVALREFRLNGAELAWTDAMVSPVVQTVARATVAMDQLKIGKDPSPVPIRVSLSAEGALDALTLTGTVTPSPQAPSAHLQIEAGGIRAGSLGGYLPPNVELAVRDGRLKVAVDAAISPNPDGGHAARLSIRDVDWRDGADGPLFALGSLKIDAPRIDLPGDRLSIDEVSLAGLETQIALEPDGSRRLLGLILKPSQAAKAQAAPLAGALAQVGGASEALAQAAQAPQAGPAPLPDADLARLMAEARRPLPLISLGKLDLGVRRLSLQTASPPAAPLVVKDLRVYSPQPLEIGGPDPQSRPPVVIILKTGLSPIVETVSITTTARPFDDEPGVQIDIAAAGIQGRGLTELLPEMKEQLDGSQLIDGRFRAHAEAKARFARRGPRDFDLGRGFDLDVLLSGIEFRGGADGPTLAGLESLQSDGIRVDKSGKVHIKTLEILKPAGAFARDSDGLHALGYVIRPASASVPGPTTAVAEVTGAEPAAGAAPSAAAATMPASAPPGEVRIDRLLVSGMDVRFEDRSTDPALLVPLTDLDMEVRDLTTLALTEPRSIRFNTVLSAGKVPLPKHHEGGGVIGAIGDVGALLGGKHAPPGAATGPAALEERELFSQITANGELALYPKPQGYVRTSVSGLELTALRGLAEQQGTSIAAGVFDSNVDLTIRQERLDVRSRFAFTDLVANEPANGFIARHIGLPAPLDVIIARLRGADGAITIPLNISAKEGQVSGSQIAAAATGALASVFATALASAPLTVTEDVTKVVGIGQVLGTGGKLFGIGKGSEGSGPQEVVLQFLPGSTNLELGEQRKLDELIAKARNDESLQLTVRHELGGGDVPVATARANPSAAEALTLAGQFRGRKGDLLRSRAALAEEAQAALAIGSESRAEPLLRQLRSSEQELAAIEQSLDRLYDMVKPGAARQADRRTRGACLEVAQQRMESVRQSLLVPLSAKGTKGAERVRAANPRYEPDERPTGGRIIITVVARKRA